MSTHKVYITDTTPSDMNNGPTFTISFLGQYHEGREVEVVFKFRGFLEFVRWITTLLTNATK